MQELVCSCESVSFIHPLEGLRRPRVCLASCGSAASLRLAHLKQLASKFIDGVGRGKVMNIKGPLK